MSAGSSHNVPDRKTIDGVAAPLPISNLDTDQLMPKQFLRGIDKAGLAEGLLYDLRFVGTGEPRPGFVLNRAEYSECRILIGGENFGCGSSREHAVWGLMQYGIQAVVAPTFGEIFYSNAVNNGLLVAAVSQAYWERLLSDAMNPQTNRMTIDVQDLTIRSVNWVTGFSLSPRHHRMFLDGLDLVSASLAQKESITAFQQAHWLKNPWLEAVATKVRSEGAIGSESLLPQPVIE
jgi:3-isopropylmalate/(R)-2-methylmalate dehydratase small subunit